NFGMRFLTHQALAPLIGFVQDDGNVTESLADPSRSALRSRHKAFPHTSFIHLYFFDEETIDIDALSVFRIGQRCALSLSHDPGRPLGNELEDTEGFLNSL